MAPCTGLEVIVVSLSKSNFKLCLRVFYRPPSSPPAIFGNLCDVLLFVQQSYFSNFSLLGDFNVNFWDSSHSFYPHLCDLMTTLHFLKLLTLQLIFSQWAIYSH